MSKICIHIGTHKTATTHIQNLFEKNASLLQKHGVVFPKFPDGMHHHALAGVWNKQFSDDPESSRALWHKLARDHAHSDRTVFVSSEELSRLRPSTSRVDMAEMRDLVAPFDEVILLCAFRNQASFIQSVYQQISRTRDGTVWAPFLKRAMTELSCDGLSLNYNRLYSHFLTGFARADIRLLSYDREAATPGGMAAAILRELACPLDPARLRPVSAALSNISVQPLVSFAANQITAPALASPALCALIDAEISQFFGPDKRTTLFTASELKQITESFLETNIALSERIQYYQPDFEIAPMLAQGADIHREKLTKAFWIKLTRRLVLETSI